MDLSSVRAVFGDKAIAGEPMSRHTTFGIGGPADLFVVAHRPSQLCSAVQHAYEHNVPFFILGSGANVLVADKGIRGLVIHNQATAIHIAQQPEGDTWLVRAESGALLRTVARQAMDQDLAGLEWAVDVPGTVGGAVVGNAGAFGGYISDTLVRALVFSCQEGRQCQGFRWAASWWSKEALKLGYRTSALKESITGAGFAPVILEAAFALRRDDPVALKERAAQYTRRRLETQPTGPSAGSVFKRTTQYPAGFLIENAGLKDTRVGGAVISPQHANFIVNVGGATAQDVRKLIELVREKVHAQFKIMLELEIQLVGDW